MEYCATSVIEPRRRSFGPLSDDQVWFAFTLRLVGKTLASSISERAGSKRRGRRARGPNPPPPETASSGTSVVNSLETSITALLSAPPPYASTAKPMMIGSMLLSRTARRTGVPLYPTRA